MAIAAANAGSSNGPFDAIFNSAADLGNWRAYFESVYGVDTMMFPFNMSKLNFFYRSRLPTAVVDHLSTSLPFVATNATAAGHIRRGDLYIMLNKDHLFRCDLDVCTVKDADDACAGDDFVGKNCTQGRSFAFSAQRKERAVAELMHERAAERARAATVHLQNLRTLQPPSHLYIDAPMSVAGAANHTFVEVVHTACDPLGMGFWFYMARGTGVYLNTGKTAAFKDHAGSWAYFHCADTNCAHFKGNARDQNEGSEVQTSVAAAQHGLDSLQYTRFVEGGVVKSEIVLTKINTRAAKKSDQAPKADGCPPQQFLSQLRGGYMAVRKCKCALENAQTLTCLQGADRAVLA